MELDLRSNTLLRDESAASGKRRDIRRKAGLLLNAHVLPCQGAHLQGQIAIKNRLLPQELGREARDPDLFG